MNGCVRSPNRRTELLLLVCWGLFTLSVLLFHEPWRDELQAWLIARDLPFCGIVEEMKYEGHFLLWFLVLKVLNLLKMPLIALNLASWGLTLLAAWFLLFRSPFTLWQKGVILFSAPLVFWYPAVARCYALIPPLLFGIAAFWPERKKHPWICGILGLLLANTHVVMEGIVLFLFLDLLFSWKREGREGRKYLIPAGMILTGVILAFLTVIRAFSQSGQYGPNPLPELLYDMAVWNVNVRGSAWLRNDCPGIYAGLFILFSAAAFLLLRRRKIICSLLAVCCAAVLFSIFFSFRNEITGIFCMTVLFFFAAAVPVLPVSPRKEGFFLAGIWLWLGWFLLTGYMFCTMMTHRSFLFSITLLFMVWLASERKTEPEEKRSFLRKKMPFLILLFLFTLPGAYSLIWQDARMEFSGIEKCGIFLSRFPKEYRMASLYGHDTISALTAYTGRPVWFCDKKVNSTFYPRGIFQNGEKRQDVHLDRMDHEILIFSKHPRLPEQFSCGPVHYVLVFSTEKLPLTENELFMVYLRSDLLK